MIKRGVENVSEYIILSNFHVNQKGNQQYFCFEDGERLVDSICNHKESPTAIFCNNDLTAIAIMYDLKQRGIRIPEDISIIGVDNNPFSYIIQPPLTSIDNSTAQIAKMATKILIEQITNNSNNVISYVKPSLVERKSVASIV